MVVVRPKEAPEDEERGWRGRPEMLRGTYICKCHVGEQAITWIAIMGMLGILFSISVLATRDYEDGRLWLLIIPLLVILVSVGCFAMAFKAWYSAKREYEALPLDHPDRIKYGGAAPVIVYQQSGGFKAPPSTYPQPAPGCSYQPPPDASNIPQFDYNQPPSGPYNQPPPDPWNQPPPDPWNQPPSGPWNQPPSGPWNQPRPDPWNQPPPGTYNQPNSGSSYGNYTYKSGQPALPPGQPGASSSSCHFPAADGTPSTPPPSEAEGPPPPDD